MENRSNQVLAVAILFISLTWLTVGMRCFVRIRMLKSFGYDDWAMLITQVRVEVVFREILINISSYSSLPTSFVNWVA